MTARGMRWVGPSIAFSMGIGAVSAGLLCRARSSATGVPF
jgi:hypothetical protein